MGCSLPPQVMRLSRTTRLPKDFRRLQESSEIEAASSPLYATDR
jgi:hypothetical protein